MQEDLDHAAVQERFPFAREHDALEAQGPHLGQTRLEQIRIQKPRLIAHEIQTAEDTAMVARAGGRNLHVDRVDPLALEPVADAVDVEKQLVMIDPQTVSIQ